MRIAITGASGLIGTALTPSLESAGHEVIRLVRREPRNATEARWDPAAGDIDMRAISGSDVVIHLAGAGVGDKRWTDEYKRVILDSRVQGTTTIAAAIARAENPPSVLVSGSAIGYYGDRGDESLDENSSKGTGFLSDVVEKWEAATSAASSAGVRVVLARTGLVVSDAGGAFGRLLPVFKAGVGGKVGNGKQYWPVISLRDEVAALRFLAEQSDLSGPVNLVGPHPLRNAEVAKAMGKALRRPAVFPVPGFALKLALGEFSEDILASQRVYPHRLQGEGFEWEDPTFEQALASALKA